MASLCPSTCFEGVPAPLKKFINGVDDILAYLQTVCGGVCVRLKLLSRKGVVVSPYSAIYWPSLYVYSTGLSQETCAITVRVAYTALLPGAA